mgnify:CR=1 FL=1
MTCSCILLAYGTAGSVARGAGGDCAPDVNLVVLCFVLVLKRLTPYPYPSPCTWGIRPQQDFPRARRIAQFASGDRPRGTVDR